MIDLHQGFSGRELEEVPPTLASLAVVQLDAAAALARGELRRAAREQLAAARLVGRAVVASVRERFAAMSAAAAARCIDSRVEDGVKLELVQRGEALDVLVDGRRVMRSDARRAEKQLVELALAPLGQRDDITVVLAGLGMGFTLRALLDAPGVERVDVVEASRAVARVGGAPFRRAQRRRAEGSAREAARDGSGGLLEVAAHRAPSSRRVGDGWLALVLDMDEGPALRVAARQRRVLRRRGHRAARDGAASGRRARAVVGGARAGAATAACTRA